MSKRLDVLLAIKALVAAALPDAIVLGLDGEEEAATRVNEAGQVVIRTGDPGEADIDLSPLSYNYDHKVPIEITAVRTGELTSEAVVDGMAGAIVAGVIADRTLGGRCDWLEASAPTTEDLFVEGARPPRAADLILTASYASPTP